MLSIVLPCYNESAGISQILYRFADVGRDVPFELILVNNGSSDNTQEVLESLLPSYAFARHVEIKQNQGYGDGILTGLKAAQGQFLAWSHADLQTDPADIFRAFRLLQEAPDSEDLIIKGYRHGRTRSERVISWGMQIVALILLRRWIPEINAQPKVFHRSLMESIPNPPIDFNFDVYVLYQARRSGWRLKTIDVQFPPRQFGESNWASNWKSKYRTICRSVWFMFRLGLGLQS
jgi:glycosyltransferase involved in cell wall biosynthesis